MATKKTDKKKTAAKPAKKAAPKKAAPKKAKSAAAPAKPAGPRHPRAKVVAKFNSKAELAKSLADSLAHGDDSASAVEERLRTASNSQLLRLSRVVETVQQKWGGRDKLIAAIGDAQHKGKDKDYLAKLEALSLPHLVELARQHPARA